MKYKIKITNNTKQKISYFVRDMQGSIIIFDTKKEAQNHINMIEYCAISKTNNSYKIYNIKKT